MNMTLIKYRNKDNCGPVKYAVVPSLWVSDIQEWLVGPNNQRIIDVHHNYGHNGDNAYLPEDWPSYRKCVDYMNTRMILRMVSNNNGAYRG